MKRTIAAMAMMLVGTTIFAGTVLAEPKSDAPAKAISVEGGNSAVSGKRLAVEIKTAKSAYGINEPISFVVQANKDAYLYLYSITPENKVVQVFPNQHEANNQIRANQKVAFPKKSKILADRPGREKFVLIATAAKLTIPTREFGDEFFEIERGEMEGLRKNIVLEGPAGTTPAPSIDKDRTLKEIEVVIRGEDGGFIGDEASAASARPLVLVTTDKYRYRLNEKVTFGYAADTSGYLKVYQVSPERKRTLITERKIEPGKVYSWSGRAGAPAGKYALVAVFTKNQGDEDDANDFIMKSIDTGSSPAKGLVPLDTPEIFTVHRFVID